MATKAETVAAWRQTCLAWVKHEYESDGIPDYPARSESWANYTDMLCKDGQITLKQYESWQSPRECTRPKRKA